MTPVFELERYKLILLMSVSSKLVETTLNSTSEHTGKCSGWRRKMDSTVCKRQWYNRSYKILEGVKKHEGGDIDLV